MHSAWVDPVEQPWHPTRLLQEEKRRQPWGNGKPDSEKWVNPTQLSSSSHNAEQALKVGTSKKVWIRFSALISHCSWSTKQSRRGAAADERGSKVKRRRRMIIISQLKGFAV